jgi:hypothetical protein
MKFNKWTLGLAAVGAVSLASTVRADELKALNTAISNTTISGVIDVAAQYNPGNVHNDGYYGSYNSKLDAFSVNQVIITLDKPLDESPWAAGYHVDLNWGSDAVQPLASAYDYYNEGYYNTGNPLRQAYVTMRTPIGNGIDWKAGLFDNILGYESNTLSSNPNYTHSVGWAYEPTSQLGLIGTYKVCDSVAVTAGLANTYNGYYGYYGQNVSEKTFLGAVTLTAPDSWGWIKGGALTLGVNQGFYKYSQNNYYAGLTLPTPIEKLKVGFAMDVVGNADEDGGNPNDDSIWIAGAYASFQATDKLSVNLRGEYIDGYTSYGRGEEVTLTAAYNLWENVVSRVELRWNHADTGTPNGYPGYDSNGRYAGARSDDFQLAFNVAYRF